MVSRLMRDSATAIPQVDSEPLVLEQLMLLGLVTGRVAVLAAFGMPQWIGGVYLGIGGGAFAFILWVMALERTTPTRVANTMTVNPLAAGLLVNCSSANRSRST